MNPRALGTNPRGREMSVNERLEERETRRIERFHKTGFWLSDWGEQPPPNASSSLRWEQPPTQEETRAGGRASGGSSA